MKYQNKCGFYPIKKKGGKLEMYLGPKLLKNTLRALGVPNPMNGNTFHIEIFGKMTIKPPYIEVVLEKENLYKRERGTRMFNSITRFPNLIKGQIISEISFDKKYDVVLTEKTKAGELFDDVLGATILINLGLKSKKELHKRRLIRISKLTSKKRKHPRATEITDEIGIISGYDLDPHGTIKKKLELDGIEPDNIFTQSEDGITKCKVLWEFAINTIEKDLGRIFDYINLVDEYYIIIVEDDLTKAKYQKKLSTKLSFLDEKSSEKVLMWTLSELMEYYKHIQKVEEKEFNFIEKYGVEKMVGHWINFKFLGGKNINGN